MFEFIIRGDPDEDFGLHSNLWPEALKPAGRTCSPLPGFERDHLRIEVEGHTIWFSPEPPGWQVVFEGDPDEEWGTRVAQEICENMSRVSGQRGEVIPI